MNATADSPPPRPQIWDSPWYWVHLFSAAAIVALVLLGPKYGPRQAQVERQAQGRDRAVEQAAGQEPTTAMSTADDTVVTLAPLYAVLAVVFIVSGAMAWRSRWRRPPPAAALVSSPHEPTA